MIVHLVARHWKKILFTLRGLVLFLFAIDIAIWFNFLPLSTQSNSTWSYLPWFLYQLSYYLFFEFFWHHFARWRTRLIHIFVMLLTFLFFGFILDLVGNTFDLFAKLWWYDRVIHFTFLPWGLSTLCLLFSRIFAEKHHLMHFFWFIPYCIFSGLALASVIHESIEYLIDVVTHSHLGTMSLDYHDTIRDIDLNMAGGLVFIAIYLICRKKISFENR